MVELEEHLLEVEALDRHLVDDGGGPGGGEADGVGGGLEGHDRVGSRPPRRQCPPRQVRHAALLRAEFARVRPTASACARSASDDWVTSRPLADDHDVVNGLCHLREQVTRDEHAAAAVGEPAEVSPQPVDPFRVESVGRLVEDQHAGFSEQRAGETQALPHPEREALDAAVAGIGETDLLEHGVDPGGGKSRSPGQDAEVLAGPPAGVKAAGLEHGADVAERLGELPVWLPVDDRAPFAGRDQTEQHPQRRGLACAVRPEKAGHGSLPRHEAEVIDGGHLCEALGQPVNLDCGHVSGHPSHVRA